MTYRVHGALFKVPAGFSGYINSICHETIAINYLINTTNYIQMKSNIIIENRVGDLTEACVPNFSGVEKDMTLKCM